LFLSHNQIFITHFLYQSFAKIKVSLEKLLTFFSFFSPLPLHNPNFPYLCLAKLGEIGWPEKAHSSLCSSKVNLDTSLRKKEDKEKGAFAVMFVYTNTFINSGV
jgi:hypothetical protein